MQHPQHNPSQPQTPPQGTPPVPPPAHDPEEIDYNELDNTEESLSAAEMTRHGRAQGETRKRNNPSATSRRAQAEDPESDPDNPSSQFSD